MPNFEQLVRPFQITTTITNRRSPVTKAIKVAPQKAVLLWGSEGQAPEVRELTVNVKNSDNKYTEKSRKTTDVRIENPDDSQQFIVAQQINNVTFTKPAATAPSNNNSGASGGAPDSVAYGSGSTPPLLPNPTVTTGVASQTTSNEEVHSFSLTQQA